MAIDSVQKTTSTTLGYVPPEDAAPVTTQDAGVSKRVLPAPDKTKLPAPTAVYNVRDPNFVINDPAVYLDKDPNDPKDPGKWTVRAGMTFDGHGALFADPDGTQSENLLPVFRLENGASLINAQVQGGDGVHTHGDVTLTNVWWPDVGEDALTIKDKGRVVVHGGGAYAAEDKIFQINAPWSELFIDHFDADGFSKFVRTKGSTEVPAGIRIESSTLRNAQEALVRTDNTSGTWIDIIDTPTDPATVPWEVVAQAMIPLVGVTRHTYYPPTAEEIAAGD